MNVEGGLQLGDIGGIMRRRGRVAAMTALVAMLAAYWIAMALPNEFSSYATVLVTPQMVDPQLVAAGVPESDLGARLSLMTAEILSRGRLSKIIDDLELYEDESSYMLRAEIVEMMRAMISVAPVSSALNQPSNNKVPEAINQFRILFSASDPEVAMQVTRTLSNDFIEQHIEGRISQSQKSLEFIEEELARLATRIRDIEARVSEVKSDNPGKLPEDIMANQHRLERLTSDLAFSQRSFAEATSDEAFYRSQVNNADAVSRIEEVSPVRRLNQLDVVVSDYRARRFTDKHPDMVKAVQEIKEIRQLMARQEKARTAEVDGEEDVERKLSFSQQSAEAERRRAALRKDAAQEEISRVQGSIDVVQQLLGETPAVAELLSGLEREYRHLFTSYQDFSGRQLEATVQAQLERRQLGEQFKVIESAFAATDPTSPDRLMIVGLGTVFAIAVGLGLGILSETMDGSVHSARELQSAIGIPVLAAIPRISLEADLAAQRRSRIRTSVGAVAMIAFALVGGGMNYVWVNGAPPFLSALMSDEASSSADENTPAGTPTEG